MYYLMHEMNHAALAPFRAAADATKLAWRNPANPMSYTSLGRQVAAGAELFERVTRRYAKPEFGIENVRIDGSRYVVRERTVWSRPFCQLKQFERLVPVGSSAPERSDRKLLIVAPMSGHYATLLRGTVEAMLAHADVHITDWADARMVPLASGTFGLDDYIDYLIAMLEHLGPDTHVMAVCQPAVPVLAAVARMEAEGHPAAPASMVLMGGPIDTRINPTAVNALAESKSIDWFQRRVIMQVPWPHPGFLRPVYPGFLQLGGFMSMNLDRHVTAHREFFDHLVIGDGDSAEKHREFYDEYLAVMDLTAEFYLETVETVFIEHALPRGTMTHRGRPVEPAAIKRTALMTIEGENDDISGVGQTEAAHALCLNIPEARREHLMQEKVGHYGIFNGSRFRKQIVPRIVAFMERVSGAAAPRGTGEVIALDGKRAKAARSRRARTAETKGARGETAPATSPTDPTDAAATPETTGAAKGRRGAATRSPSVGDTKRTASARNGAAAKIGASRARGRKAVGQDDAGSAAEAGGAKPATKRASAGRKRKAPSAAAGPVLDTAISDDGAGLAVEAGGPKRPSAPGAPGSAKARGRDAAGTEGAAGKPRLPDEKGAPLPGADAEAVAIKSGPLADARRGETQPVGAEAAPAESLPAGAPAQVPAAKLPDAKGAAAQTAVAKAAAAKAGASRSRRARLAGTTATLPPVMVPTRKG